MAKRLRPADLASRLADALRGSADPHERLIARILLGSLDRLKNRIPQKKNRTDDDLARIVAWGVAEGWWKSNRAACIDLESRGLIAGAGTPASRVKRLYELVQQRRQLFSDAARFGTLEYTATIAMLRAVDARKRGVKFDGADPSADAEAERAELLELVDALEKSIDSDIKKSRSVIDKAAKSLIKSRKSSRARRHLN